MQLQMDLSRTYAIALEGGGAKGAYQIGVWQALEEADLRYNAVSGSSVGALNGAFMTMRDLEQAKTVWEHIAFSQIMEHADDKLFSALFDQKARRELLRRHKLRDFRQISHYIIEAVREGGIDVTPLQNMIREQVSEERIRQSDVDFFLMTYSLTERTELDIAVKELPEGQIHDMLLASAYFPVFKHKPMSDGKRYTDGGVQDLVPIHSLISRGYTDILVLRIYGLGIQRHVRIPDNVRLTTIAPKADLGPVLRFDAKAAKHNMKLGYFDGQRALYGLRGERYYLERTLDEKTAYHALHARRPAGISLRRFHENLLPTLARELGLREKNWDYYDLFLAQLEKEADAMGADPFCIRTDRNLAQLVWDPKKVLLPTPKRGLLHKLL